MSHLLHHEVRLVMKISLKPLDTRARETRHWTIIFGIGVYFYTEEFNVPIVASNYVEMFCQHCMSYNKFL